MSIAKYIREIGRGKEGARALSTAQAHDLMTQVLEGRITDLELGAFAIAMRIKGETPEELAGFLDATRVFCLAPRPPSSLPSLLLSSSPVASSVSVPPRMQVWLPSYNGARKLPNLTALLALLLAREGVPVLVHGPAAEPGRVATAEIFQALGLGLATDAAGIEQAWQRGQPAFVTTDVLCPPLARLLAVRRVVGLRNSGHTVAKLLHPMNGVATASIAVTDSSANAEPDADVANAARAATDAADEAIAAGADSPAVFRVVNHTHPEYAQSLSQFLAASRADAMLLRGTEGEPVADARRTPRMEVFRGGESRDEWGVPARDGVLTQLPELPAQCDAATTAAYIEAVLAGRLPLPRPIAQQVACIVRATSPEFHPPAQAVAHAVAFAPHHESIA